MTDEMPADALDGPEDPDDEELRRLYSELLGIDVSIDDLATDFLEQELEKADNPVVRKLLKLIIGEEDTKIRHLILQVIVALRSDPTAAKAAAEELAVLAPGHDATWIMKCMPYATGELAADTDGFLAVYRQAEGHGKAAAFTELITVSIKMITDDAAAGGEEIEPLQALFMELLAAIEPPEFQALFFIGLKDIAMKNSANADTMIAFMDERWNTSPIMEYLRTVNRYGSPGVDLPDEDTAGFIEGVKAAHAHADGELADIFGRMIEELSSSS